MRPGFNVTVWKSGRMLTTPKMSFTRSPASDPGNGSSQGVVQTPGPSAFSLHTLAPEGMDFRERMITEESGGRTSALAGEMADADGELDGGTSGGGGAGTDTGLDGRDVVGAS